jgi:hypothetical protein
MIEYDEKRWLLETGDIVERDCGEVVCNLIPFYAVLWAWFIGNDGNCSSYPIQGIETLVPNRRKNFEHYYERLCAAHYTLFNHVFSANSKIEKGVEIQKRTRDGLVHATFLENLEEFYFHYGVVMVQIERLWAIVYEKNPDMRDLRICVKEELMSIFGEGSEQLKLHGKVTEIIDVARNDTEHYSRQAIYYNEVKKQYFKKTPRKKGESWSETQTRTGDHEPVIKIMRSDFKEILDLINCSYPKLIEQLEFFFSSFKVQSTAKERFENSRKTASANISSTSVQTRPLITSTATYPSKSQNASGDSRIE